MAETSENEMQNIFNNQFEDSKKDPLIALDLDSVKSKHGDEFMELRDIINRHDPIKLIEIGAPENEYDSEVKTIIVQIDSTMTEAQVHDLVYQEFLRWFEDESTAGLKNDYQDLSTEIYGWIKK